MAIESLHTYRHKIGETKLSQKVNDGKKEMKGKKLYVFKHENVRMTDLTKDTQRKGKKRLGSYTMQCNAMHIICTKYAEIMK